MYRHSCRCSLSTTRCSHSAAARYFPATLIVNQFAHKTQSSVDRYATIPRLRDRFRSWLAEPITGRHCVWYVKIACYQVSTQILYWILINAAIKQSANLRNLYTPVSYYSLKTNKTLNWFLHILQKAVTLYYRFAIKHGNSHITGNSRLITHALKVNFQFEKRFRTSIYTSVTALPIFICNIIFGTLHKLISPTLKLMRNVFLYVCLFSLSFAFSHLNSYSAAWLTSWPREGKSSTSLEGSFVPQLGLHASFTSFLLPVGRTSILKTHTPTPPSRPGTLARNNVHRKHITSCAFPFLTLPSRSFTANINSLRSVEYVFYIV